MHNGVQSIVANVHLSEKANQKCSKTQVDDFHAE